MSTPNNFGGLPAKYSGYKNANVVVLPIPFDGTSTWGKGADKGPAAIIEASRNMELYDIETDSEVYKKVIFTAKPINAKTAKLLAEKTSAQTKKYLADNKFTASIGGEHSVSLGPIMAYAEKFKDLSVLHLDAHSDRRDSYEGDKYSHACVIARAQEYVKTIVSVGIRSMDVGEKKNIKRDKIFYAHEICTPRLGGAGVGWVDEVTKNLTDNVYLTIDLDVFDIGIMPSTGTPEPGGLNWYEVVNLIKEVSKQKNIVGLDVVELAPNKINKAPDFLAAKLIYTILGYVLKK